MPAYSVQIALGTVTNVDEAVRWLSYTYLYVRMRANPLAYGISHKAYQVLMLSLSAVHTLTAVTVQMPFRFHSYYPFLIYFIMSNDEFWNVLMVVNAVLVFRWIHSWSCTGRS